MNISFFQPEDYPMIESWWKKRGEVAPSIEMMPASSFVVTDDDMSPLVSVSLFVTNTSVVWVDNLISNPMAKKDKVKKAVEALNGVISAYAKKIGKSRLFCMSLKKSTSRRYQQLGFMRTAKEVETFVKEI